MCSEEKYELPRGSINAVNENKWQITKHYPKKIPWLISATGIFYVSAGKGIEWPVKGLRNSGISGIMQAERGENRRILE